MKKVLAFVFALMATISINADELYLVGDGTPIDWTGDGTMRQPCRMTETSSGVFVWTGLLKHGGEGFKIVNSFDGWNGYHPSTQGLAIADTGSDTYTEDNGKDWKWNPANTDWQWYTITLDKNAGTLSWAPATPTLLEPVDGVISIGTAEELNTLAFMIRNNVNGNSYNVKLTADIDYTEYKNGSTSAIGISENLPFKGEFDGQNHTITVDLESYSTRFGFFGTVQGKVHNLKLAGKITATNRNQTSGFCGLLKGNDNKIYNCVSTVEIIDTQSGDGTIGGFCAVTYDATSIENCAFYGQINAPFRNGCAGIVGWCNSGAGTTIKNCLIVADINWAGGEDFGRNNPSVINSYKTGQNDATLASGEMTYKLNGQVSGAENWFQTLGTDAMPSPLSSSEKLYANGTFYCDGVTSKGGDVVLSNVDESVVDDHVFGADGVCTGCHAAGQAAEAVDGVFQLGNAGNLLWWAAYVNAGNPASNAVLTADINLSEAIYTPAGNSANKYIGTFDGQEHSVTLALNNPDLNYQGLFGVATDGATIKNVLVKGSVSGKSYVAGIVGGSNGSVDGKKLSIINCGNEATIKAAEANGAGIIGVNMSGQSHFYILNCYNAGDVTSGRESGAITGWTGGDRSTIENTYNIGVIKNGENTTIDFVRGGGNLVNTYMTSTNDARLASGELCYLLNAGGDNWYQNLTGDVDAYPVPFSTGHSKVYANAHFDCGGNPMGNIVYGNEDNEVHDSHQVSNGFCTVCNSMIEYIADYMTPAADGYYEIADNKQMRWFAAMIKDYRNANNITENAEANAPVNARLMNDIDFTGVKDYEPIGGLWGQGNTRYAGTFDGQGFSIKNLVINLEKNEVGVFGVVADGAVIKNFTLDGSCSINGGGHVGIIGEVWRAKAGAEVHLECLGNEADITGTGNNVGGILGVNMMNGGYAKLYMTNCYSIGKIKGNAENGQLSGWTGDNSVIENCYAIGEKENCDTFARRGAGSTTTNSYCDMDNDDGATVVTEEQLASGELAYKLGAAFSQFILIDNYPSFGEHPVSYVGEAGYATLYDTTTGYVLNGDVKAYVATIATGKTEKQEEYKYIELKEIVNAPVSTPVILKGKYYNKFAYNVPTINEANDLKGTDVDTEADGTQYVLAKKDDKVGFYKATSGTTIAAGKAYIQSPSNVKAFYFDFAGDATGIAEIENGKLKVESSIFNLAGQRVNKMQKGINIVNGKKVLF